jgi:hypothetical protein
LPTNHLNQPSEEPSESKTLSRAPDLFRNDAPGPRAAKAKQTDAAAFDRFWAIYPRRVAKGAARKAFAAAIKRADVATIIDGARRYASERSGQDQKYTAHPATWLNADRWTDEPAPVNGAPVIDQQGNPIAQPQRRHSGLKPSALSMMFPGRRQ